MADFLNAQGKLEPPTLMGGLAFTTNDSSDCPGSILKALPVLTGTFIKAGRLSEGH